MKQVIINAYQFNLAYTNELVSDLNELQMTVTPGTGLENHPAWTLGHLVTASGLTAKYLGGIYEIPDGWDEIFRRSGPGDPRKPLKDSLAYPKKQELLDELLKQHNLVEELIISLEETEFNRPAKWRFDNYMPNLGDLIYFMCITHESMHLSQLASWRRAMDLDSALGKL